MSKKDPNEQDQGQHKDQGQHLGEDKKQPSPKRPAVVSQKPKDDDDEDEVDIYVLSTPSDFVAAAMTVVSSVVLESMTMPQARQVVTQMWKDISPEKRKAWVSAVQDGLQRVQLIATGVLQEFMIASTGDR